MRVVVFGASGMVGHGALRACVPDEQVTEVLAVVRWRLDLPNPKMWEVVHTDFTAIQEELKELDVVCQGDGF
ncbi:hypothetical protein OH799_07500 [Nocardia sp. NBC_00881]|uniref:hypothetical protein n=1 Tax=Nocardia sp. NBC_00881 TaxID=2975995 RepID=UPI0038638A89|nr:hypothetical protein OH799_07500 [Nocardia sp. NBC_00881]